MLTTAADADVKTMLSKTVIVLYLYGFQAALTYNIELDFFESHKELSNKIYYICNTHFSKRVNSITISAEVSTIKGLHVFNDFAGHLLKSIELLKVQIDTFGYHDSELWDYINIIYVDSESSFRRINPGEKTKHQDYNEFYLVIYQPESHENQFEELEAIFAYCWSYYIVNVSIMLEDPLGVVRTFTYFPFNENECFSTSVSEIMGSEFGEIFPSKVRNLHQCELIGALWLNPPYISWNGDPTEVGVFLGMEGRILKEIASNMNFRVIVQTPPNDVRRGFIFKNGTLTGAIKMLQDKEVHFSLGCFRYTFERATVLSASYSYYQTDQVFFVKAHAEHWSAFEILLYPFDIYIWTMMLAMILTAIMLSIFLKIYKPSLMMFVFGSHSGIFLSVISAWLGSPITPEPRRNFARFLLILWIFATLILRNAYQGLLYNFMSTDMGRLPPDTFWQLAMQHYVVIVSYSSNNTLSQLPLIQNGNLRVRVEKINEDDSFQILENAKAKLVSSLPKDFVSYYVRQTRKYGVFHVLKESIFAHQICVYFTKHSFLTHRFNEILKSLRSFGLTQFWMSRNLADDMIERQISSQKRELSLNLHQLHGIFLMLSLCLFASTLVLIVELMSLKYRFFKQLIF